MEQSDNFIGKLLTKTGIPHEELDKQLQAYLENYRKNKDEWTIRYIKHVLCPEHFPVEHMPDRFPTPSTFLRGIESGTLPANADMTIRFTPQALTALRVFNGPGATNTSGSNPPSTVTYSQVFPWMDPNYNPVGRVLPLLADANDGHYTTSNHTFIPWGYGRAYVSVTHVGYYHDVIIWEVVPDVTAVYDRTQDLHPDPPLDWVYVQEGTPPTNNSNVDTIATSVAYPFNTYQNGSRLLSASLRMYYIGEEQKVSGYFIGSIAYLPFAQAWPTSPSENNIVGAQGYINMPIKDGIRVIYFPKDVSDTMYADFADNLPATQRFMNWVIGIKGNNVTNGGIRYEITRYWEVLPDPIYDDLLVTTTPGQQTAPADANSSGGFMSALYEIFQKAPGYISNAASFAASILPGLSRISNFAKAADLTSILPSMGSKGVSPYF